LNSWEAQLLNKLSSKIFDIARDSSNLQRLCLCSLEVLCVSIVSVYPPSVLPNGTSIPS
jgi:hypothetical protein